MNYERIYNQIIENARAENRQKNSGIYYEAHHIIPKCLGGKGQTKDLNHPNIVLLTAKEHYIAHRLLCLIYPTNNKLFYALWMMSNHSGSRTSKRHIPSSRIYEKLRLQFHNIKMDEDHRRKIIEARKGKTYEEIYGARAKEERRKRIQICTEATRKKQSASAIGRVSHFNGRSYKEIYGDDWKNQIEIRRERKKPAKEKIKKPRMTRKGIPSGQIPKNSIPVTIDGITYTSISKACSILNVTRSYVKRITTQVIKK